MVAAVGMGGHLAINGAVAHAFSHILYKGLLFMGTGVVVYDPVKRKLTETGGLYKKMPAVFWLYMIGAVSISGFPLFSGFVSKGMVTYAAESAHHIPVFIMLLLASVGTFLHTGLKLPYFIWFGEKKDLAVKSIPKGMYVGMGLTALSCAVIGLYPRILYDILPYGVHYQPYTVSHLWETVCILVFTALVFWLMIDRVKPKEGITLDFDWFYRRPGPIFYKIFVMVPSQFFGRVNNLAKELVYNISAISANPVGNLLWNTRKVRNLIWNQPVPDKEPANYDPNRYRNSIGAMVLLIMIAFIVFIIVSLLS
jgi:multicomponent Na+:H+ antiporter subunit D